MHPCGVIVRHAWLTTLDTCVCFIVLDRCFRFFFSFFFFSFKCFITRKLVLFIQILIYLFSLTLNIQWFYKIFYLWFEVIYIILIWTMSTTMENGIYLIFFFVFQWCSSNPRPLIYNVVPLRYNPSSQSTIFLSSWEFISKIYPVAATLWV